MKNISIQKKTNMIQIQTKLKINDNSGIKIGQCIKIYKSKVGKIGDKILISAKKLRLNQKKKVKIRKGDLFKALIIHTTYQKKSTIGNMIKFFHISFNFECKIFIYFSIYKNS